MSLTFPTGTPSPSPSIPKTVASPRIASLDIFRGMTMAVMIFVNELAEMQGMPWWTRHAPGRLDLMTYVDMVFPFFLFAVGMSLPLSIAQRLRRNPSAPALWLHIATRFLALLGLGLILANAERADPTRTGMSSNLWGLLGLLCSMLYLAVYGKSGSSRAISRVLRVAGLGGVVALFAIFRHRLPGGQSEWIETSYPEILGLIAFAYLAVALLYIPFRRYLWAPAAWLILLVSFNVFTAAGWISFPARTSLFLWPVGNGSHCALVMAGILTSSIYLNSDWLQTPHSRTLLALGLAAVALVAGWLLTPLGISKIRATPTWTLYSIGAAVLLFTLLYWVTDVWGSRGWARPVHSAGSNTLLTYLLPDLWYFGLGAAGVTWFRTHWNGGWPGVVWTTTFTALMLAASWALSRMKVRLQL
jgi:heparan-alpha-glucosaminide N-acetyltransferase